MTPLIRNKVRGRLSTLLLFVLIILVLGTCLGVSSSQTAVSSSRSTSWRSRLQTARDRVTTVVASQKADNTTWMTDAFPEWSHHIYVTDDRDAPLTVPMNKGRESMVYLTYVDLFNQTILCFVARRLTDMFQVYHRQLRHTAFSLAFQACKSISVACGQPTVR